MVSAANTEVQANGTWTSNSGYNVASYETDNSGDYTAFSGANTDCQGYTAATAADLEWREGFALAGEYFISDASSSGTITSTGENGNDRVGMYGELSGTLEEQVWRITVAGGMDAEDVAVALFVNEGDDDRSFR